MLAKLREHLDKGFVCYRTLSININSKRSEPLELRYELRWTCPKKVMTSSIVLKLNGFSEDEKINKSRTMKNLINQSVNVGVEHIVIILQIKKSKKTNLRFEILGNEIQSLEKIRSISSLRTINTGEMIVVGMVTIQTSSS